MAIPSDVSQSSVEDPCDHSSSSLYAKEATSMPVEAVHKLSPSADEVECLELQSAGQRRVTFQEQHEVRETLSLSDYSEEEMDSCWPTQSESASSLAERGIIISRMSKSLPPRTNRQGVEIMTYRGLECWTNEGNSQITKNIDAVVEAVLVEQKDQRMASEYNPVRIADISIAISEPHKAKAKRTGEQDAMDAKATKDTQTQSRKPQSIAGKVRAMQRRQRRIRTTPLATSDRME